MPDIIPKKMGCCSLCDAPIRDVISKWTDGPLAGEVRSFGASLGGAKRSTVILKSGSRTDFSLCADCNITPVNMPFLWKKALLSMAEEVSIERRQKCAEARGVGLRYTPQQQEACQRVLDGLLDDLPMGVLFTQPWAEIENG